MFSPRIVGWSVAGHHCADLVADALNMALAARRRAPGLILHSDQGAEYTSWTVHKLCARHEIRQSMGSVGDCFDNAMAESVFATIETELLWHHTFVDNDDARSHFTDFVEGWYNTTRRHTSIGNISPMRLEQDHANSYTQSQPVAV